jgi:hypothetical protein
MQPVFSDRNPNKTDANGKQWTMATAINEIVYNPGLNRYIVAAQGPGVAQTSFYDSPNPWGPWTVISYNNIDVSNLDSGGNPRGGWANFGMVSGGSLGISGIAGWTSADGKTVYYTLSSTGTAPTDTDFIDLQGKNMDAFSWLSATIVLR